jgi:hypothetical protein
MSYQQELVVFLDRQLEFEDTVLWQTYAVYARGPGAQPANSYGASESASDPDRQWFGYQSWSEVRKNNESHAKQ